MAKAIGKKVRAPGGNKMSDKDLQAGAPKVTFTRERPRTIRTGDLVSRIRYATAMVQWREEDGSDGMSVQIEGFRGLAEVRAMTKKLLTKS
jgi:hypothetical protein